MKAALIISEFWRRFPQLNRLETRQVRVVTFRILWQKMPSFLSQGNVDDIRERDVNADVMPRDPVTCVQPIANSQIRNADICFTQHTFMNACVRVCDMI